MPGAIIDSEFSFEETKNQKDLVSSLMVLIELID